MHTKTYKDGQIYLKCENTLIACRVAKSGNFNVECPVCQKRVITTGSNTETDKVVTT